MDAFATLVGENRGSRWMLSGRAIGFSGTSMDFFVGLECAGVAFLWKVSPFSERFVVKK